MAGTINAAPKKPAAKFTVKSEITENQVLPTVLCYIIHGKIAS